MLTSHTVDVSVDAYNYLPTTHLTLYILIIYDCYNNNYNIIV